MDADAIKEKMIEDAKKDLEYHTNQYNEDIKRCDDSNKWVSDLMESVNELKPH